MFQGSSWASLLKILETFIGFLYTGLKFSLMSVSLFVASLDSAGLSLVTCEFLLFSGVNFATSGLVCFNFWIFHSFLSSFLMVWYDQSWKITLIASGWVGNHIYLRWFSYWKARFENPKYYYPLQVKLI